MMIKHLYRTLTAVAALVLVLAFTGCKKFLDADQPLQVKEDIIYSTENGFTEALTGVYMQMGTSAMYGRDLTYGLLSVLGRSYDTTMMPQAGALYYQGARYNFEDATVKKAIESIWDSSYQCIANLNHMLAKMEEKRSIFTGDNYSNLKAEAMALRAYLHFDLLRMFGPAEASKHLDIAAIPYLTKLSPFAVAYATTGAVLDSCLSDLNNAAALMLNKTKTSGHINYWGIKALQARIYLYKGDIANAKSNAAAVLANPQYALAKTNNEAIFSTEHVFNLLVYGNFLSVMERSVFNTSAPMGLLPVNQNTLYVAGSGSSVDWRKANAFLDPATNSTTNSSNPNAVIMPKKFSTTTNNALPMIRVTEMYYIAAECARSSNDFTTATTLLDSVRVHRNLPAYTVPALSADSLETEIRLEYMKEMIGEGQVFYYFKRKNLPFNQLPFTKVPVVASASYTFPKPE